MMTWTGAVQVFACLEPTDMRKSFDGLCGIVRNELNRDAVSGEVFCIFRTKLTPYSGQTDPSDFGC